MFRAMLEVPVIASDPLLCATAGARDNRVVSTRDPEAGVDGV